MVITRRRGATLEVAIMDATLAELAAVGYRQLTMEGVAARAGTSKQVLYRRWRNRVELVLAAVRYQGGSIADDVPDTGSLRGDVLAVLGHMTRRFQEFGPDVVHGLLSEAQGLRDEFSGVMEPVIMTILKRAADRGEVDLTGVTPRMATMAMDLMRHELLLGHREVGETTAAEIVDDIYLPLLRGHR